MNSGRVESSVGLDRFATPEEVRSAMSLSPPAALEFVGLRGDFSETGADSSSRAPNLREEIEWLMIVREMRNCISN